MSGHADTRAVGGGAGAAGWAGDAAIAGAAADADGFGDAGATGAGGSGGAGSLAARCAEYYEVNASGCVWCAEDADAKLEIECSDIGRCWTCYLVVCTATEARYVQVECGG